ncbi:MAG: tRNA 5-methoxyuridine(34)/uridine 5-oxyacetic acid(34) synthase CmoB [Pseudomonadales bacterium]|jgi:tRNA (mo5U34)-methyltransferase|nr:tRNA 5-methoxyuridine(34)/uridine 5-oxyacetic acid(34) synthase CmoB [Pseudomonadales bacterium]
MQSEIDRFLQDTCSGPFALFTETLKQALDNEVREHGRRDEWDAVLDSVTPQALDAKFDQDTVQIGSRTENFELSLKELLPWRKGPFNVGETFIDTEWRSDWKWQRIKQHLPDLTDQLVLDIGCGNGYHLFRMLGDGAKLALGIDPTILFNYQFALLQKLCPPNSAYLLPLKSEHLPPFNLFDTVFSLGVLYHRRSPLDHLQELFSFLRPGGLLVLETLVIEGDARSVLMPVDRYAKMGNVWFIPSTGMLEIMMDRIGFRNISTVDVNVTSLDEQRATDWMQFQSLADYLDPIDRSRTIEGYPAPTRAILMATRPS